ncbi:MAG: Txe/YoeB family addiction module toxin [Saprospiraceae bacterium]
MKISFHPDSFADFNDWALLDKGIYKKIVSLIKEIRREPFGGIGKPEPLKYNLSNYWSRRITNEHRLVYKFSKDEIVIISCRGHYL